MIRGVVALALLALSTRAVDAQDLVLEEDVAADAGAYFEVPFEVPEGTVEIEVRHDDPSDANVLDWGLRDPDRIRGWGGGNDEPAIVGVDAASRSYLRGPIEAGTWAVIVGQALVPEPPARYRIEIFFRTSATLTEDPDRMVYEPVGPLETGPRWYAGDFHVHSLESGDARATLDEAAAFAATRGLDFIELQEHNTTSHTEFLNAVQARHPSVLLMPGIEVTTYQGHANAIGVASPVDWRVMSDAGVTLETITAEIEAARGLFAINHPALDLGDACIGCAWTLGEAPTDAVEIQNGAYSVTGALFYRPALRFWDALLDDGSRAAAIGGSDDHRAGMDLDRLQSPIGSPTTMVFADALSVDAIVAGVRAGRTVVKLEGPDDPMVELTAGDAMVGDTVEARAVTLRALVTGATGATLAFVRNGETVSTIEVEADPFEATLEVSAPFGDTDDRWRAQLAMPRPRVVTSHLWVRATGEPPPPDAGPTSDGGAGGVGGGGCGCGVEGSAPGAVIPGLLVWLFSRRRVRRG